MFQWLTVLRNIDSTWICLFLDCELLALNVCAYLVCLHMWRSQCASYDGMLTQTNQTCKQAIACSRLSRLFCQLDRPLAMAPSLLVCQNQQRNSMSSSKLLAVITLSQNTASKPSITQSPSNQDASTRTNTHTQTNKNTKTNRGYLLHRGAAKTATKQPTN